MEKTQELSLTQRLQKMQRNELPLSGNVRQDGENLTLPVYCGGAAPKRVTVDALLQQMEEAEDMNSYSYS